MTETHPENATEAGSQPPRSLRVAAVQATLREGLSLLGIAAPDQM